MKSSRNSGGIFNNLLICVLFLSPFIQPAIFIIGEFGNNLYNYSRVFFVVIIAFLYICKNRISSIIILIVMYQLTFLFSTAVNSGTANLFQQASESFSNIAICLLVDMIIHKNAENCLKAITFLVGTFAIITIFTMFKHYPVGMYIDSRYDNNYYFLGQDNSSFFTVLPSLICMATHTLATKNRVTISLIAFTGLVAIGYIYVQSAAASLCLLLFIFFLFTNKRKLWNVCNIYTYIFVFCFIFLSLLAIGINDTVTRLLLSLLNRDTLSIRLNVWGAALSLVFSSPIIGYGYQDASFYKPLFNQQSHAHNIIFEVLLRGGIVSFALFVAIIMICCKKLYRYRYTNCSKVLSISMFMYLLLGMFDYYNYKYIMFAFFVIAYNINIIIDKLEVNGKNLRRYTQWL